MRIRKALFVPDPLPPLAAKVFGTFEPSPGVVAERITYASQFGMRVPAILYRPKNPKGNAPAFIVVNGHGGDKFSWYALYSGVLYARAGAFVLTYDPAGEGERNSLRKSGTRAHDKVEPPVELQQRVGGLMMTDLMQAVTYLSQRQEVDPKRIAAAGYSMGSFVLTLTGAADPRLKACVMTGGGNVDGPEGYWDRSKPMCQASPYRALQFLGDRPAALYALHAARGPALVFNGREDSVVNMPNTQEPFFDDLRRRAAALRGSDKGLLDVGWVEKASHRPYFVTKPVALWLEQQLDFPNWTRASIEAMGETHISEWAKANHVDMDPGYVSEHREGGTRALGEGVPGIKREDLFVLSAAEWEKQKEHLVHEGWLAEARKRLAN
ncbi:MAG: prolyl oligopeptidase family serine peptidase [Bryobacteraceae bacterium]